MLLSPRKNGLTSLFKEVRVFKAVSESNQGHPAKSFTIFVLGGVLVFLFYPLIFLWMQLLFLRTVELLCLQLCSGVFCLQLEFLSLTVGALSLTVEASLLTARKGL